MVLTTEAQRFSGRRPAQTLPLSMGLRTSELHAVIGERIWGRGVRRPAMAPLQPGCSMGNDGNAGSKPLLKKKKKTSRNRQRLEALWPEGGAPTSHTSQLSGPQTMPDPLSHPLFPPGHLEPFIPTVSCISAFSRGYSHWAQPLHIAPGGRALGSHLAPWRSDGPRKTVSADCPAWAQPAPLLGAGTPPAGMGRLATPELEDSG